MGWGGVEGPEGGEEGEGGGGNKGAERGMGDGWNEQKDRVNGAFEDMAEMDADDRLQAEGADDEAENDGDRENMDEEEDKAPACGSGGGITPMDARLGSWSIRTGRVSLYGSVGVRVPAEPGSGGCRDTTVPFDAEWGRKGSCGGLARECGFGESKGRGAQ